MHKGKRNLIKLVAQMNISYRFSVFSLCLFAATVLLSGCLTRRNAIPSNRGVLSAPNRKPAREAVILTDASAAPRNVRPTRAGMLEGYAEVLGVRPGKLENQALYRYIDEWMGTPHRLGGTNKRGVDCSAFVNMLMQEVYGKSVPRTSGEMAERVKRKYERQLQEGDLIFFSFGRRNIDHVGVYLHNNKFVHVSTSRGVIISDLHDSWYYKYFRRAGSVR